MVSKSCKPDMTSHEKQWQTMVNNVKPWQALSFPQKSKINEFYILALNLNIFGVSLTFLSNYLTQRHSFYIFEKNNLMAPNLS